MAASAALRGDTSSRRCRQDLAVAMQSDLPGAIADIGTKLQYRDFITVGVLYRKLRRTAEAISPNDLVADNGSTSRKPGVKVGRLQIFNNWSPYMVADPDTVWVGLEFFARDGDELWAMSDEALRASPCARCSSCAWPTRPTARRRGDPHAQGLSGLLRQRYELRRRCAATSTASRTSTWSGRNGMHRYNNQDSLHAVARYAAEAILAAAATSRRSGA
jgi:hypothetical protein